MASAAQVAAIRRRLQLTDRSTLMTLAKEYGIKANSKNEIIVESLIDRGYVSDRFREAPRQPEPQSYAPLASKRKLETAQHSTSKRACTNDAQPGSSSLQTSTSRPAMNATYTQLPYDHPCPPSTYQRIEAWRYSVFQALTTQRLTSSESDPSGYNSLEDDDDLDCPDHTRDYQCWKCVSRPIPSRQPSSFPRRQKSSLPPSLAHLLNPETPRQRRQVEKRPLENETQAIWDELEPSDSSSVRHLRVRPPQQSPQSSHVGSSSHPHLTQFSMLRPTASTLPSSRTISHSHSQSFGRTTDSLDRTTPSHSYPNTPTPVAAPPPIYIPRTGDYISEYHSPCANEDDQSMARILQEQPHGMMVKPLLQGLPSPSVRTPTKLFQPVTNHLGNIHSYFPVSYSHTIPPPFAAPRHGYAYHNYLPTPAPTTNSYSHHLEPPSGHDAYKSGTLSCHEQPRTQSSAFPFSFRVPANVPFTENENLGDMFPGPPMGERWAMGLALTTVPRLEMVDGLRQEHTFFT